VTVPLDPVPTGGRDDPPAPSAPDPVEQEALRRALDAALAEVRPEHRAAVTLRYEEGLSFEEIGRILGIPAVTARSHVHRARKALLRRLTGAGWKPAVQRGETVPRKP
jgi:RNA polymerase sigma-70 factor (ECF subfamily)